MGYSDFPSALKENLLVWRRYSIASMAQIRSQINPKNAPSELNSPRALASMYRDALRSDSIY
jgi:hypothetical protein